MTKTIEKEFRLAAAGNSAIWGDVRWPAEVPPGGHLPVLIICHGFKAFKDWGPFPAIGRRFAELGFVSIVFNFSHNGIGVGARRFTEPEKFACNTLSLELDDVRRIVDAVEKGVLNCPADLSRVGLIGHSRGGGIALIGAKEDARIRAVSAWASVSRFDRYSHDQKVRWRENGSVTLSSVNTRSPFRLGIELLDDIEENGGRLNILDAVAGLGKPLLIVHGTHDVPVRLKEAELLFQSAEKNLTEFVILEGAGHAFGAKHPYRTESREMSHVVDLTASWFQSKM
ncbi:MAG: prolyl oligopeptidase family serine peptidase [Ignavibacteriales bacterium]|nr:prolyl oligopeptidase family serine peptidase [Ignavibacteriales bacterium]